MAAEPEIVGRHLVTLAFVLVFSAYVSTASGNRNSHRRPNSDREYREHDIHGGARGRCCEVRLRHRIGERRLNQRRTAIAWISKWPARSSDATPINSRAGNSLVVK